MERLKQAMERARAEREQAKTATAHDRSRYAAERGMIERAGVSPVHGSRQARVAYRQIREEVLDLQRLREKRVITPTVRDPREGLYKALRTNVLQRMQANDWTMLGITSARRGHGKSLTALNLAISLARGLDQTILLVDFDLRHPSIATYLLSAPVPGLSDYLRGDSEIGDILFHPGIERLVVLPGREPVPDASEYLSSPLISGLVEELKSHYRGCYMLFDLPPVLGIDDVLEFSLQVDGFLLVVEDGTTTRDDLRSIYRALGSEQVLGTVLNKAIN